jgi:hypothetical protein
MALCARISSSINCARARAEGEGEIGFAGPARGWAIGSGGPGSARWWLWRMRSESDEFVLFPLVRQGTGRGGGPRPRVSDPLPVGAARGVVSCQGEMLRPSMRKSGAGERSDQRGYQRAALPAGAGRWQRPAGGSYRARSPRSLRPAAAAHHAVRGCHAWTTGRCIGRGVRPAVPLELQ